MSGVVLSFLIIQGFIMISGQRLTFNKKFEYAKRGQYFDFFCLMKYDRKSGTELTVVMKRGETTLAAALQKGDKCQVLREHLHKGYNVYCANDDKTLSEGKQKYQLRISRVAMEDQAEWYCKIKSGESSNKISLKVFNFSIALDTTTDLVMGQKFYLSCTIAKSLREGPDFNGKVCIIRKDKQKWCMKQVGLKCYPVGSLFDFNYEKVCSDNKPGDYLYSYGLKTKRVSAKDVDDWWCQVMATAQRSNILKLHPREGKKSLAASSTEGLVMSLHVLAAFLIGSIVGVSF